MSTKTKTRELLVRLRLRKINSIHPRPRTRRTGNCHTSILQRLHGGRAVYSTTTLEELEVTPETEDKRYLVVANLGNPLSKKTAGNRNKMYTICGSNPAAFER